MSNHTERPQGGNFFNRWCNERKERKLAQSQAQAHLATEIAAQPARKKITEASITSIVNISSHLGSRVDVGTVGYIEKTSAFSGDFFTISFQDTEENLISFNHSSTKIIQEKDAHFQKMNMMITEQDVDSLSLLTEIVSGAVSLKNVIEKRGKEKNRELLTSGNWNALSLNALVFEGKTTQEGQFRTLSGIVDQNHKLLVVQQGRIAYIITQKLEKYTNENPSGFVLTSIIKIELADGKNYYDQKTEGQQSISFTKADTEYLRQVISAIPESEPILWGLSYRSQYGDWLSNDEIEAKNAQEKALRLEKRSQRQIAMKTNTSTVVRAEGETDKKETETPQDNEIRRAIIFFNQSIEENKTAKIAISWENLWKELGTYYRDDAYAIMKMIAKGTGVIVNAPCGSGKTRLLTPQIKRLAQEQGWAIGERADFPDSNAASLLEQYEYTGHFEHIVADIYSDASSEQRKLLILDESARLGVESLDKTEVLFSYLREKNISAVLLNATPQEKMRMQATQGMIEIANKVGLPLAPYEQKQKGFLPIDIVKKYLGDGNIEPALLDFLTHPDNDAFRDLRLFFRDLIPEIVKEAAMGIAPIRTLSQLRSYASEKRETWMRQLRGGSKETLIRGLKNLDVIKSSDQSFIDSIEDYN